MKLVFVHGSGGSEMDFYYQTHYFEDSEAVNLPGHPDGVACQSIPEYVQWLRGYFFGKGYEDIVLSGHSMGGGIVLHYALMYPDELKAIIPIGSGARLRVHPKYLAELHDGITDREAWDQAHREQAYDPDPQVNQLMLDATLRVGPTVGYTDFLACDNFDLIGRVEEIKLPTLAFCGSDDEMTPPLYTKYLEEHIPNCKTLVIEGAGHSVMSEKPGESNRAIEDFLKSLS